MRFFFSPVAAVFLPASFFSGALDAVEAGALEAGFLSALGGILKILVLVLAVMKNVVLGAVAELIPCRREPYVELE